MAGNLHALPPRQVAIDFGVQRLDPFFEGRKPIDDSFILPMA